MLEMNDVEKAIIELLKKGYSQNWIATYFEPSLFVAIISNKGLFFDVNKGNILSLLNSEQTKYSPAFPVKL